ncbi:two component regulator with propeller domain [Maribacter spongiicola]|uniref:histidine kinase n=2 Tax=Maribacter spongiicola TaxID=1206753 RepID=A0A4R7K886_9FLAO|nr:two component regulator with propeller domain [Maribacter spongiicola]
MLFLHYFKEAIMGWSVEFKILDFFFYPLSVRCISLISTLLFQLSFLFGQDDVRIKYYSLKEGISQVTINELLKDSLGFVWIGTQDGLNRFDGKKFKTYKYDESDDASISGNHVTSLLDDKSGNIWVGTLGNGLNLYDYELDVFRSIDLENLVPNETILDMVVDHKSNVWITTRKSGLYKITSDGENFIQENFLKNTSLSGLYFDNRHNLWVGGYNGTVYKFDLNTGASSAISSDISVEGDVQAFFRSNEKLFIGTEIGMFLYDTNSKQLQKINLNKYGGSPTRHVVTFLKADDSTVWVGTGSGLFLFDVYALEVVQNIQYSENETDGLSNNTVQSLLKNSENQILVGTANNLNLLDFKSPYFKNISKNKRGSQVLNDNVIFSILKDGKDLWVGTSDGGLNLIREDNVYYFQENQNDPFSISGNVIREICKDEANQRIWIATTRGLSMIDLKTFDIENPKFKIFRHVKRNSNTISNDFLKGIALDSSGIVWGATFGHGIFSLKMDSNGNEKIYRYKNEKGNSNSLINDFAQCITIDKIGNIWIGSQGGLTKLSLKNYSNPVFTNYARNDDLENSLSHNSVYDILVDDEDNKWVATRYGLNLWQQDGKFKSWTEQNQFTSAIIYGVQDDLDGNLWLGTTAGIVNFNPRSNQFKQYGVQDGIQSNEFDIHARFRDDQGFIYLGGIDGLTYFHPRDLTSIDAPQPLYFSEFRIKDQVIKANSSPNSALKESLLKTKELKFNNNQFPFYLQFSSVDFRLNKQIEYGYKLLPNNKEWNMLKDPEIQFLNLPSGNHTLLVNGFSRGVEWDQEPLKMKLHVIPPWWSTWWAYMLYVILVVVLAYFFYKFQVSRKLAFAESNRLKEIDQLKNSLYTNITHEFRTPLTVILGMAETIKENLGEKEFVRINKPLEIIARNGKSLLHLVNEMLELAKLESGNIELQLVKTDVISFIKYICESFQSYAYEKKVNLVVYSEVDSLIMDVDENKLQTIIYNLLSNAIKFLGDGDKIIVHLNSTAKNGSSQFLIKVKDNGMGISKDDLPHIFNRFYQADASIIRSSEGTGIGLSLTKNFIELMGGNITVKSELGKGTEFTVYLPIFTTAKRQDLAFKDIEMPVFEIDGLKEDAKPQYLKESNLPIALIIEDNVDVVYFLKNSLETKYQTVCADNGKIGVEKALSEIPDIIICDVMMPVMDGYEVCKTLKSDKRTDHIPIIMLTAKSTQKDRIVGLSHGADAYLVKPFEKAELFIRLDQLIAQRKKMVNKFESDGLAVFLKTQTKNPRVQFLQKVIEIIQQEMANSNFGPKQLAFKLELSESQTYRKLKTITDKSTAVFIRSVRLNRAKEMLYDSDMTVSEIAYSVGFNDPSWFSRAFKNEFGYAPSAINK